jgi:hypothetical protein
MWKFFSRNEWRVGFCITLFCVLHLLIASPYHVFEEKNKQWMDSTRLIAQLHKALNPKEPETTIMVLVTNSCKYPIEINDKFSGGLTESYPGGGGANYGSDPYRLRPTQYDVEQSAFTIPPGQMREYEFVVPDNFETVYERGAADFNFNLNDGHTSVSASIPFNAEAIHSKPATVNFNF